MAVPFDLVSGDAKRALEEFSDEFRSALALGEIEQWAEALGLVKTSKAIKSTYPIPVHAAGYNEFKGDMKYRSLYSRSLSMKPKQWQDGVAELERIISAPDFSGWNEQPAAMAMEAMRQPNKWVAAILAANPNLDFYRDDEAGTASSIPLFSNSHPVNVFDAAFGTFDNDHAASAIDADMMVEAKTRFRQKKGPNGEPMGLRLTHMLVPAALEETAKEFLEQDLLIQAVENLGGTDNVAAVTQHNRHKGTVQLLVADELTASDEFYLFAKNKPGLFPWIVQKEGSPEEILHDKDSAMYKSSLKVGLAYILTGNAAAALPHCIERITLT